jgi:hypothetical protein
MGTTVSNRELLVCYILKKLLVFVTVYRHMLAILLREMHAYFVCMLDCLNALGFGSPEGPHCRTVSEQPHFRIESLRARVSYQETDSNVNIWAT